MQIILMGTILILIVLIIFMLVAIKSVSVNIRDKIRLDTAHLFSHDYNGRVDTSFQKYEKEVQEKIIYKDRIIIKKMQQHELPDANYLDSDFLKGYYAIKEKFVLNINDFLEMHSQLLPNNEVLATKILETLNFENVYRLSQLTKQNQMKWLLDALNEYEYEFICNIYEKESDIFQVYQYCKELSDIESKPFVVRVPMNFNQQIKYPVVLNRDDSIAEGFQIVIYGMVYDYSIQRSELV